MGGTLGPKIGECGCPDPSDKVLAREKKNGGNRKKENFFKYT